jgi:hypothetical protein
LQLENLNKHITDKLEVFGILSLCKVDIFELPANLGVGKDVQEYKRSVAIHDVYKGNHCTEKSSKGSDIL